MGGVADLDDDSVALLKKVDLKDGKSPCFAVSGISVATDAGWHQTNLPLYFFLKSYTVV